MNEADIQKMVDKVDFFQYTFSILSFLLFKVDVDNDGSIDFKEFKKMME